MQLIHYSTITCAMPERRGRPAVMISFVMLQRLFEKKRRRITTLQSLQKRMHDISVKNIARSIHMHSMSYKRIVRTRAVDSRENGGAENAGPDDVKLERPKMQDMLN